MANEQHDIDALRQRAIERIQERPESATEMPPAELGALVNELEVCQVELEIQDEELRRAEEALEKALGAYRDLYERAPVAYLTLNPEGRILDSNHAASELCFRRHEELKGERFERIAILDDRPRLRLVMRSATFTGLPQASEFRIERPRGGMRWVHAEIVWLRDSEDTPGYRIMLIDVTSRVEADDALREQRAEAVRNMNEAISARARAEKMRDELRESEERFRLASDAGAALVYELDLTGGQRFIVYGLERVTGYKIEEENLTVDWWKERIHTADLAAHQKIISHRIRTGDADLSVYRVRRKNGSWICVEDVGQLVRDAEGNPVRMVGTVVDITDRVRAAEALREADRRKNEFLATLAHELRNPLAPIRNAVEVLRTRHPQPDELEWARDVIDRQIDQMARLVDDLLDVSRITHGKVELRKEQVALSAVIDDAIEASRPLIERAGHTLLVEVAKEPIMLDADRMRLAQAVLNLLNNAAKYTPAGGKIWLTAGLEAGLVAIRVEDTGIGMAREVLPVVFDMFTQGQTSIEQRHGGIGIGLTLVRRMIEMHGGEVEARSNGPGTGSEFIIRLPLASDRSMDPQTTPSNGTRPVTMPRRVLVVDDNHDSAESMAMYLDMIGHEVRVAHDGLSAVKAADAYRPDVVLLDIGLPGVNGYEVARRIRRQRGNDVLLIAMTGWGQEEDRRRSEEAGFDHHFTKPVDFDQLNHMLTHLP